MTAGERADWQEDFRRDFAAALGGLDDWERPPLEPAIWKRGSSTATAARPSPSPPGPACGPSGIFSSPMAARRAAPLCSACRGTGAAWTPWSASPRTALSAPCPARTSIRRTSRCNASRAATRPSPWNCLASGVRRDAAARAAGARREFLRAGQHGRPDARRDPGRLARLGRHAAPLDYLQTRTDCVDPARLAVLGISGGGLAALFTAAWDTRVRACLVSAYFNTFRASILSIDHCVDNYVPGLLRLAEMPDLAALVAPRALFAESGRDDPIFPAAV